MKEVNGIFIQASDEELSRIWTAVSAHGFNPDSGGVLKLLMLAVDAPEEDEIEEEEVPVVERLADFVISNPDKVADALRNGKATLFNFMAALQKKKGSS